MGSFRDVLRRRADNAPVAPAPRPEVAFDERCKAAAKARPQPPEVELPATPSNVFVQYQPLIDKTVGRWASSGLPKVVLDAEAKRIVAKALGSHDPSKGTLGLHLQNHLQQMDAFVNTFAPDVRVPLDRLRDVNKHVSDDIAFRVDHGYAPQNAGALNKFQTNLYSKVQAGGFSQPVKEDLGHEQIAMDFLYHDLPKTHKLVFAHSVGYNGMPKLTTNDLATKLGVSAGRVSQLKNDIAQRAHEYNYAIESLMR
jgi:hypothetical protein